MSGLVGYKQITDADLYDVLDVAPNGYTLGEVAQGTSGDEYRLVKVGASPLVAGNVVQSPAFGTSHNALTPDEVGAGTNQIVVTNGSTTFLENAFAGGTLTVSTGGGIGSTYRIIKHTAGGNATKFTVTLDRPLRAAVTSTTRVSLRVNECSGVIQAPASTLTGVPVGVAIVSALANKFCWVQVSGVAAVLSDGTSILMGSAVATPSATAGAATLLTAGKYQIGTAMQAAANGTTIPVKLSI